MAKVVRSAADEFFANDNNKNGKGDKSKLSDKESDPSGLGFDDNYDDAFF